ncbi:uncharacterized protein LOC121803320 [Salvia splendens]|uniref:uncharacterized protein LOC121803320 n=1 Tax=Salvia splendens TaxID=180675 RepID=UPI001C261F4E|nr:uncharacterized protein LOC121803320 [Salvia splendens]
MAVGRRQLAVLLLLLFLVVSSTAVPASRSLKTIKNQVLLGRFHVQDVSDIENDDVMMVSLLERRMNIELTDYPGTGANNNHDPKPPVKF